MTTLLTITEAGNARELDAIASGAAVPKIDRFIFGAGPAQADPYLATPFEFWHSAPVFSVEKLSKGTLQFTCHLGPEVEGEIREIGLLMQDGTLYGYSPVEGKKGSFWKGGGFPVTWYSLISKGDISNLDVTYAPMDITALTREIAEGANARISVANGAFQVATIRSFSAGNRVAFEQQRQINKQEARK